MKRAIQAILFFISAAPLLSYAQGAGQHYSFTVKESIDYALKNQTKVLNSVYDEQIAQAKVDEVFGAALPQVSGNLDIKRFFDVPTQLFPAAFNLKPDATPEQRAAAEGVYFPVKFGLNYNGAAGIDVSQLIFDGSYIVSAKGSKAYLELSKKATDRTKIETSIAVSKAYYSVLISEERLLLLDANLERLKKLTDDTKVMFDNGLVEKIDYDRLSVNYNSVLVEEKKVKQLVSLSYYLLKYQMGMNLQAELTLTDRLDFDKEVAAPLIDKLDYNKRVEYSLAKTQERIAELDLLRNKLAYLPSVAAYGSFSENAYRNTFSFIRSDYSWYTTSIIGARLTLPIFDGFQKNAKIKQARLTLSKSQNDLNNLQQGLDLELKNATVNYSNNIASLQIQNTNKDLALEVAKTAKIKYDQGVGSNLEVITAETSLKEAQTNYFSALYDFIISKIDLQKAQGAIVY
jgi:outer membrane protein